MPRTGEWNAKKLTSFQKEGRGTGEGKNYIPWIKVGEFGSVGWSSKDLGWKTARRHDVFSENELDFFYLLEWSDHVIDIREQYPLLEIEDTMQIANKLAIKHPADEITGFPYALTTDFLIVLKSGKHIARTVKPSKELERISVLKKFEIERRYWEERSIDWGIVTEKDLPKTLIANITWIHSDYRLEDALEMRREDFLEIAGIFKDRLLQSDRSVITTTKKFDQEMYLEPGTSLRIFKYLVAHKEILVDMNKKIKTNSLIAVRGDIQSNMQEYAV